MTIDVAGLDLRTPWRIRDTGSSPEEAQAYATAFARLSKPEAGE